MKVGILLIIFLSLFGPVWAGSYVGKIQPYYFSGGLYLNPTDSQRTPVPACATRNLLRLQETDPNDAVYKQKYALLLACWLGGRPVALIGNGQCTSEGDEIIFQVIPG